MRLGAAAALAWLAPTAAVTRNLWFLPLGLLVAYGAAWIAHGAIEKNRPATWQYFAWSLASDFRMLWLALTGRLGEELRRCGVGQGRG